MTAHEIAELSIAADAERPEIRALDVSMFDRTDFLNMLLQRSETLFDVARPGRIIKAWSEGDEAPIAEQIERLGAEIARRTAAVILGEYRPMQARIQALNPRRVADIGCGYAIWDLLAHRDTGCEIVLIDIEENDHRHFGYANEGAAYTSLQKARAFLVANGVPEEKVQTLNPKTDDLAQAGRIDLAVSFVSCGFHYPAATYLDFFRSQVAPAGSVLLDLRLRSVEPQIWDLAAMGPIETISGHPKARRILLRKMGEPSAASIK
ncbi:methyltransferase family protein [Rhodobacter aestuarii]|uniref:Methyltransferase domain-containing protein n=1 Tax=Rhodobacter aestuarii TaxID=453582 RepID=A0A1N7Q828_9RHOB|nr:methyltransferase domain-containing protein [Rhodobacter aestuarii]PTV93723.1 methyltransferase family protein [Rhodobacter aestuarii]SIT19003.1 Methyltransferase domain-containing protein [Rhodobacter aestuarii]